MNKIIVFLLLWALVKSGTDIDQHSHLIAPYFDEVHYTKNYGDRLGKEIPLSHFLGIDFKSNFQNHIDPTPWFNTTLYLRCFPCDKNPFVDFLSQPPSKIDTPCPVMDVYAREDQLTRTWLAVEALLRLNKFRVVLHLTPGILDIKMFEPQILRGLELLQDNVECVSFYKNRFLSISIDGKEYPQYAWNAAVSEYRSNPSILVHRAYLYTRWFESSSVNPLRINAFHSVDEPLGRGPEFLEKYIRRIYSGFDLVFFPYVLGKNCKLIPGYMSPWIDPSVLSAEKEFSVSYLLSMGNGGLTKNVEGADYQLRRVIWDSEKELSHPTRFYISRRDMGKYPVDYQTRALPTDTKKWIFDSQFNIAVENCRQVNYMTEKLLGCILGGVVPIYFGCPNVGDFLDIRGIFIVTSLEDIIKVCKGITSETYVSMLPFIEENKRRALELMGLQSRYINEFVEANVNSLATHSLS